MYRKVLRRYDRNYKPHMNSKPKNQDIYNFEPDRVWAASYVAFLVNGKYVATSYTDLETREDIKSNISIALELLNDPSWQPNDEVVKGANEAKEFWQRQLFKVMTNTANDYTKSVTEYMQKDAITTKHQLAIIVSCIGSAKRGAVFENAEETKYKSNSTHQGKVKEQLELTVEVLQSRFIATVGKYVVECVNNSNLYSFFYYKDMQPGAKMNISGKVRKHDLDFRTKVPVTVLNYVKVLEVG